MLSLRRGCKARKSIEMYLLVMSLIQGNDVFDTDTGDKSDTRLQDKVGDEEEHQDVFTGDESDMRRRCIRHWYW